MCIPYLVISWSAPSNRNKFQPMRTADPSKSTNQRPGDGACVIAIRITDTHNISTCTSMLSCCHHQYYGFQQERTFRNIDYKLLIFLVQNSIYLFSTRNPRVDQKWSTLDQKWLTLDQIWSILDQNWSNPKIFFWDFWSGIFAQNSILVNYSRSWKNILGISIPSCIFRLDQKWSRVDQIWSNLGFRVGPLLVQGGPDLVQGGPLLVQGGPLLVQPRVSSTGYTCKESQVLGVQQLGRLPHCYTLDGCIYLPCSGHPLWNLK